MKKKDDEDWVKKLMEIRIEGMKSVSIPFLPVIDVFSVDLYNSSISAYPMFEI